MEDAARGSTSIPGWLMWSMVVLVSVAALARVLFHWRAYDVLARFEVVMFGLLLVALPVRLAISLRNNKPLDIGQMVIFGKIEIEE